MQFTDLPLDLQKHIATLSVPTSLRLNKVLYTHCKAHLQRAWFHRLTTHTSAKLHVDSPTLLDLQCIADAVSSSGLSFSFSWMEFFHHDCNVSLSLVRDHVVVRLGFVVVKGKGSKVVAVVPEHYQNFLRNVLDHLNPRSKPCAHRVFEHKIALVQHCLGGIPITLYRLPEHVVPLELHPIV